MKIVVLVAAMAAFAGAASACPFSKMESAETPVVKPVPTT
jgi:hypothetical protein